MIFTSEEDRELYMRQARERIKLTEERDALFDKIGILKMELKEQEQRNQDLLGIRNALQSKLDASERANAEMRKVLERFNTRDSRAYQAGITHALSSDAGRDYVSLAFHEQEMKDLERERQYVADKLMQKGDHSLPEAVDRWVSDYVPREKLERAQMGCALVRTLATVLRANHPPDHAAYKIAQDIEERLADRGHDYVPKSEVEKAELRCKAMREAALVFLGLKTFENELARQMQIFTVPEAARPAQCHPPPEPQPQGPRQPQ